MNKLSILLVLLLGFVSAQAQTTPAAKARVAEIRRMYADAKARMAQSQREAKDGLPANKLVANADYMVPGSGPSKEVISYHFSLKEDEEGGPSYHQLYFLTRKYNVAARTYYQEFLYDGQGRLVFFFEQGEQVNETRYYWNGSELVHRAVKGMQALPDDMILRLGEGLQSAFDHLMNRDY